MIYFCRQLSTFAQFSFCSYSVVNQFICRFRQLRFCDNEAEKNSGIEYLRCIVVKFAASCNEGVEVDTEPPAKKHKSAAWEDYADECDISTNSPAEDDEILRYQNDTSLNNKCNYFFPIIFLLLIF